MKTTYFTFRWAATMFAALSLGLPLPGGAESPAQRPADDVSPARQPARPADPAVAPTVDPSPKKPDVIFVPTPQEVVDKMLELAEVKAGDVVYDLGCGDGRIVVAAAKKYGVRGYGFDIDPKHVQESLANVKSNKVEHLVTIKQADIFTLDLREASVVTLYLLPDLNVRLMPQLAKLKRGSRIVSHDFDMRGAKPVKVHHINAADENTSEYEGSGEHTIYKWVVPWEPDAPEKPR